MLNMAMTQGRLPSTTFNPILATENLLHSNGCDGFSIEGCCGVWRVREGVFPGGRYVICSPTESFTMRVRHGKAATLFVVPLDSSELLLQNGWEIPPQGFGVSAPNSPVVIHSKVPSAFALVWMSCAIPGASDFCAPSIITYGPERKKISIDADGETLSTEIGLMAGILAGESARAFEAKSPVSLKPTPRRLVSRLSLVLEAWELFESKLGEDLNMPDIAEWSDIGSRTLEYAFKEIVGRTPIGFFKVLRLHRARRLILCGDVPTVRDASTRCGIRHFGRFSIDYRLQFGEQARQALRSSKTANCAGFFPSRNASRRLPRRRRR